MTSLTLKAPQGPQCILHSLPWDDPLRPLPALLPPFLPHLPPCEVSRLDRSEPAVGVDRRQTSAPPQTLQLTDPLS